MKKGIHPEMKKCAVTCACGATFETESNQEVCNIEVCNKCHPFYSGTAGKHKKTGAVEKFNKKFNLGADEPVANKVEEVVEEH